MTRYYKAEADGYTATRSTENSKYVFACPATGTFSGTVAGADRVAARSRQYHLKYGRTPPHYSIVRVTEIDAAEYRRLNKARRDQYKVTHE